MLEFTFTNSPGENDLNAIKTFYHSLDQVAIEQYPGLAGVSGDHRLSCTFVARKKGRIVCTAQIMERTSRGFHLAEIEFGPLFATAGDLVQSIRQIHRHYTRNGFAYLAIGLGLPAGKLTEEVETGLGQGLNIRYLADDRNWTTTTIDLSRDEDEILRRMSKGHRSGIKKAYREGVHVRPGNSEEDIRSFTHLHQKMLSARGRPMDSDAATTLLDTIQFLERNNMGTLLLVNDRENQVIGGVLLAFQGDVVRYYKGAADPDVRDVAVLHPALFEAMKHAKQKGFRTFDLWGYNHLVPESDQRYAINRFKKGFGGDFVDYPRIMHCSLGLRGLAYRTLLQTRNWMRRAALMNRERTLSAPATGTAP